MLKLVRFIKAKSFVNSKTGKPSKLREFSVKDHEGNRTRTTFWESFKNQEDMCVGQVLVFTNLLTGTYPKNKKPKFLQTGFGTTVKDAPKDTYDALEKITDVDAR